MKRSVPKKILRGIALGALPVLALAAVFTAMPWRFWSFYHMGWQMTELACAAFVVLLITDVIYLIYTRAGLEQPVEGGRPPKRRDRIPLELWVAVVGLLAFFTVSLLYILYAYTSFAIELVEGFYFGEDLLFLGIGTLVLTLLGWQLLASLTVRVRWKQWYKNTLVYLICRRLFPLLGRFFRRVGSFLQHKAHPAVKAGLGKTAGGLRHLGGAINRKAGPRLQWLFTLIRREFPSLLGSAAAVAVLFVALAFLSFSTLVYGEVVGLLALLVLACLLFLLLAATCIQLRGLFKAAAAIAAGDVGVKVKTDKLLFFLEKHGENLNRIGDGLTVAVEERMRSEKLKTDLITNVSHDIKTPLTSIVSYVDLLRKQPQASDEAREYLAVLERQSARLKKLTEDLVEASKAATGSLPVSLAPTGVLEILNQALGEYNDRMAERGLETVVNGGENLNLLADGRHLWRVFDNLLGNICKYAQSGTRVYFDIAAENGQAHITVKNISAFPLNVTADELMERFTRGDASRTTEGSGLGLSIARSLVDLQGGAFTLTVDGDLFKTDIALPAA